MNETVIPEPGRATERRATEQSAAASAPGLPWSSEESGNNLDVLTLLLSLVCLAIGALGFALRYERPVAPAPPEPPILAQTLQAELPQDLLSPPEAEPAPPDPLAPPPPPDALASPPILRPIAVAQPSPAIAFPLPVERPASIVEAKRADYVVLPATHAALPAAMGPPAPQALTFGQGEGKQPAPDYPPAAKRQGQEGTVLVRFSVGETGRVISAEVVRASPWRLLNEAALRAVRERWHFPSGPARLYEVTIRFEIVK